jgi:hypothetical protein
MKNGRVSVLLIKKDEIKCLIEKDDSHWLDILKETICDYLKDRFIAERDSVLSFCQSVSTFKELQVLVNTFINPIYPFSWIIAPSILPDLHDIDIQEFLLEPIVDETIPEVIPEIIDSLIEPLAPLEPVPYVPSEENLRHERKMRELEAQIEKKRLLDLEETQRQDQRLKELKLEIEKNRLLDELAKLNAMTEHVQDIAPPE